MQFSNLDILNIYKSIKNKGHVETMALLLAMYQKMKLIREKNQATFELTKFSSKVDRVSKNIEKVQKRYTSLFANLDAQAKQMQSNAKIMFQNMYGLGMGNYGNYIDPSSFSGMNGFVTGLMQKWLSPESGTISANDGKGGTVDVPFASDGTTFAAMMQEYMANGGFLPKEADEKDANGNTQYLKGEYQNYSKEQVAYFMYAMQNAKLQQQQAQMACSNMSQQYDTNVSVWLEAAKAQLEAEQDAALEPLNYQQTMWELEKEQAEQRLTRIKAELESYTQLCSEEAKESAPKFGLG